MIQLKSLSAGYLLWIFALYYFSSNSDRFEHIHPINLNFPGPNTSSVICDFGRFFVCVKLSHMIPRSVMWASYIPSLSNWINCLLNPNVVMDGGFLYNTNRAKTWIKTPALMFSQLNYNAIFHMCYSSAVLFIIGYMQSYIRVLRMPCN